MIKSCLPIRVLCASKRSPRFSAAARWPGEDLLLKRHRRQLPPSLNWEKLMARAAAGSMMGQAQPQATDLSASGPEHDRAKLRPRHSRQVRRGSVESPAPRSSRPCSPLFAGHCCTTTELSCKQRPRRDLRTPAVFRRSRPRTGPPLCCKLLALGLICQTGPAVPRHAALLAAARRDGSFALEAACAARPCGPRSLSGICGRYPPPDALHLYPTAVPTRTEQISWRFR
jgi:hypothetical protein